jgi:hypothetical protein
MRNLPNTWPALYQSDDLRRVRMLATCLSAMEFEVHLCCHRHEVVECGAAEPCPGPFVLRVPREDLGRLAEVVEEIFEEQEEFDLFVDQWNRTARQNERRLLLALVLIVGALSTLGAIEV